MLCGLLGSQLDVTSQLSSVLAQLTEAVVRPTAQGGHGDEGTKNNM